MDSLLLNEKKCPSCKKIKPIREFFNDKSRKDGHAPRCKECHRKSVTKWQKNNAEKVETDRKKWRASHRELDRRYAKQWAKEHQNQMRENNKNWRAANPDYGRNWQQRNKDKVRNYQLTRRARIAGNGGEMTVEEWNAILDFYGHKCLCCGKSDVKMTIDHVIPIFHGGKHSADNVQPLCGPCNSRKKNKHIDYRKEKFHAPSRD